LQVKRIHSRRHPCDVGWLQYNEIRIPRVLVKIGIELSSVIVGGLILIILGCIIYAIVQQMWPSMWILIAMVAVLIMVTAGAGILDVLLEEASINLGLLMQS